MRATENEGEREKENERELLTEEKEIWATKWLELEAVEVLLFLKRKLIQTKIMLLNLESYILQFVTKYVSFFAC